MLDEDFWKRYFKAYDLLNSAIPYQELLNDISASVKVSLGKKILDAGSGTGNLSIKLRQEGAEVRSVDFSREGVTLHKAKDSQASALVHDLTQRLPFQDDCFDGIVSNNVIYTISQAKRKFIFDEFCRVLKPGGTIVVADVKKEFRPLSVFIDHIKKSLKANGFFSTLLEFFKYFSVLVKVLYYNHLIKKENDSGDYDFLEKDGHKKLLLGSGFSIIGETKISYAKQSYIDVGKKI